MMATILFDKKYEVDEGRIGQKELQVYGLGVKFGPEEPVDYFFWELLLQYSVLLLLLHTELIKTVSLGRFEE